MRNHVLLYINGRRCEVIGKDVFRPLADFLRSERHLTGTKVVCAEGACGACSVLKGRPDGERLRYRVVNSCIQFLYQADGCHIVTVEGLTCDGALSAVQKCMVAAHGAQCGFCTPGMVVALTAALEAGVSEEGFPEALSGNLCRCTGYLPLLEAGRAVARAHFESLAALYPESEITADLVAHGGTPFQIEAAGRVAYGPATWEQALRLRTDHPTAMLVAGATELAVQESPPETLISLGNVSGLADVSRVGGTLALGAAATWTQVKDFAQDAFPELAALLSRFGAPAIRNMGTVAGSIVRASSLADSLPALLVLEAQAEIVGPSGMRLAPVDALDMLPNELVRRVLLPLPRHGYELRLFKVSGRRGFDRSLVCAALLLERNSGCIGTIKIALGGVGPHVQRLPLTEAYLQGRSFDETTLRAAGAVLRSEIAPVTDGRASAEHRGRLAENMLLKFFHAVEGND